MCQLLVQSIFLASEGLLWDFYSSVVQRNPVVIFPVLFAVLIVLGLVACEVGACKDPVRRHKRLKKKKLSESQTIVRL